MLNRTQLIYQEDVMKKFSRILIGMLTIAMLVAFTIMPVAAAPDAFAYQTGFQVQNLDATQATVTINFVDATTGASAASVNDTIPASGSKTYFPLPTSVPTGFKGSVVISSNARLASIVNIIASNPSNVSAAYVGASSGNTTLLLPLLMKGNAGYNTWFSVQNVGTTAAIISVAYSDGTTASSPAPVPAGASYTFYQNAETHSLKVFSGVVTSAAPVAATVIEEGTSVIFAYSGFNSGSKNPVMPLINTNNAGIETGVQIQNVGTADSAVTVTYTPGTSGTACTETQTVPAGQSKTFALNAFAGVSLAGMTTTCTKTQFVGSAQVTTNAGNSDLVVVVNQVKPGVNGEAYGGFDPSAATAGVVMPLIMDRVGTAQQFWTGFSVMNVGTAAVQISCTFTNSTYTVSQNVAPGASLVDLQNNKMTKNYAGSGTCTAPAGSKLVGVVNELSSVLPGDNLLVYEAISQ
jgi:hypothetical protein